MWVRRQLTIPCRTINSSAHHSPGRLFFARPLKNNYVEQCFFKLFLFYRCNWRIWRHSDIIRHDWFSPTSTKTKNVIRTMWYLWGWSLFISQIRVGIRCGSDGGTSWNSNILNLMDSSNPDFDGGSRNMWGFFVVQIYFQFTMYYIIN